MLRFFLIICFWLTAVPLLKAEESEGMPWIGVSLIIPDVDVARPQEMQGLVGLMVDGVVAEGPLAQAGGVKGDIWWKLEDQILVNTGQLVALLKMREPGDVVTIHLFREGKLVAQDVKLGARPLKVQKIWQPVSHFRNMTTKSAQTEETAEMTDGKLHYALKENQEGMHLRISEDQKVLFEGPVDSPKQVESLDARWQGGLLILRQALAARSQKTANQKVPRVRYIPPQSEE